MNERRKKAVKQMAFGVILLVIAGVSYSFTPAQSTKVSTFSECAEAGNPIMESYPRQCKTKDGKMFKEDIGNELEKDDLIRISEPRPNSVVTSPFKISGMARGSWFSEGSFPVRIVDGNGEILARGVAETKSRGLTKEFFSFAGELSFSTPTTTTGMLFLDKDSPSGLPEYADTLWVPIRFSHPL